MQSLNVRDMLKGLKSFYKYQTICVFLQTPQGLMINCGDIDSVINCRDNSVLFYNLFSYDYKYDTSREKTVFTKDYDLSVWIIVK